ncbi:hypothetical protein [Actinomadura sp. DC4]|uniref:hypothetical protein n=1 Tax=Actinomadura sp. DC4 TaxID=3055069 RepID=UPI0025AFE3C2|nr:hypothetical protein [Actinomadura sp. DC4]MDN3354703.1 hypothetical protein [Actinomadura sp. DC4]
MPFDRVMRFFAARLCLYVLAGLVVMLGTSLTTGVGWLSAMRQGILPWIALAFLNEWIYRRDRGRTPFTKRARIRWAGILVVDGTRFRWAAVRGEELAAIAVERAAGRGRRIVAQVGHDTVIGPALVEQIIREALEHGWVPRERGREVTFRMVDDGSGTLRPGEGML